MPPDIKTRSSGAGASALKVLAWFFAGLAAFMGLITLFSCYHVIQPGHRGVKITLGHMDETAYPPGMVWKTPMVSDVIDVSVQQGTGEITADCYSADLQQIKIQLKVLYRIPDAAVVSIVRDYSGDPFNSLIVPRVQEAIKEVTAGRTAAEMVKTREEVKNLALDSARKKVGAILLLDDLVLENLALSDELEKAIEAKMVQQQRAEQASFNMQQAEVDAKTAIIKAEGEAKSILLQGQALKDAPTLVMLKMVEKWDGHAPTVLTMSPGAGVSSPMMTLPLPVDTTPKR